MQDQYVYFLYSEQQRQQRTAIEARLSRTFIPGTVIVNGVRRKFTEMSLKNTNLYPDVKVIAEGYKSKIRYTDIALKNAKG